MTAGGVAADSSGSSSVIMMTTYSYTLIIVSTAGVGINQLTITHAGADTLVNDLNEHATNDNLFVLMELYPTAAESSKQMIRAKGKIITATP